MTACWSVRPSADGRWLVFTPVGTQACSPRQLKDEAILLARSMAGDEGGGYVRVELITLDDTETQTPAYESVSPSSALFNLAQ